MKISAIGLLIYYCCWFLLCIFCIARQKDKDVSYVGKQIIILLILFTPIILYLMWSIKYLL